jgi:hypothetical protein
MGVQQTRYSLFQTHRGFKIVSKGKVEQEIGWIPLNATLKERPCLRGKALGRLNVTLRCHKG